MLFLTAYASDNSSLESILVLQGCVFSEYMKFVYFIINLLMSLLIKLWN